MNKKVCGQAKQLHCHAGSSKGTVSALIYLRSSCINVWDFTKTPGAGVGVKHVFKILGNCLSRTTGTL